MTVKGERCENGNERKVKTLMQLSSFLDVKVFRVLVKHNSLHRPIRFVDHNDVNS